MKIEIEVTLTVTLWARFVKPEPYYAFSESDLVVVPLPANRLCIYFVTTPDKINSKIEEVTKLVELKGGTVL